MKNLKITLASLLVLWTFSQVSANNVSDLEAANYLWAQNIIVDKSSAPAEYNLEKNILRQEIAWTIAKLSNLPESTTCKNLFKDVTITENNSWTCPRIESLLETGMIAKNNFYRPMSYVSKTEALGFILWALYKNEYEKSKDANLSWQQNAINFAKWKNILREEISNFNENASRWFIFKVIYYAKNTEKSDDSIEVLKEIFWEDLLKELEIIK